MVYITAILSYITVKVPKAPLTEAKTFSRSLVGDTQNQLATLHGKAGVPLTVLLNPQEPWVQVEPTNFELHKNGKKNIRLRFTPPLAGPATLQIQATTMDPWGLTKTNQKLQPIELHIIPKAKYAQWLAKKFLEQTATSGTITAATRLPSRAIWFAKQGVEYQGSRIFQPGDRLKNVDWKHSLILNELISKEFEGTQRQPTIIAANVTVENAEEADKIAFNFVMTSLTLAIEALPTALAIYNCEEVLAATPMGNPRETLKEALKLSRKITLVDHAEKALQSTEVWRLDRFIRQLEKAKTESAQKLQEILQLEKQANQKAAKDHPASRTLTKAAEHTPPPAFIAVLSARREDDSVLSSLLGKLEDKGYNTVQVTSIDTPKNSFLQ
jgi:hypothetical protein